jgi:hypothetical protein
MECPDPACQTPEYPYSPGELVEDARPGAPEAAAEVAERIVDPFGYTVAAHRPGEQFGVRATMEVYLKGGMPVQEHHRMAGWLERHMGELEHDVEAISPEMFLAGARAFLRAAGVEDVLMISLNDTPLSETDDKMAPPRDDLDSAISNGLSKLQSFKSKVGSIVLEAFGTNEGFEVQLQLRFRAVHPPKAPGMILYLWALPHELMARKDESEFFYEDRVNEVLQDKARVEQLEDESRTKMEALVSSYETLLAQQFPMDRASREIEVDLKDITV